MSADDQKQTCYEQPLKQKVTKNSRAVMKQREQAEILKEGTTPAI
jgi:hypothetical protein